MVVFTFILFFPLSSVSAKSGPSVKGSVSKMEAIPSSPGLGLEHLSDLESEGNWRKGRLLILHSMFSFNPCPQELSWLLVRSISVEGAPSQSILGAAQQALCCLLDSALYSVEVGCLLPLWFTWLIFTVLIIGFHALILNLLLDMITF